MLRIREDGVCPLRLLTDSKPRVDHHPKDTGYFPVPREASHFTCFLVSHCLGGRLGCYQPRKLPSQHTNWERILGLSGKALYPTRCDPRVKGARRKSPLNPYLPARDNEPIMRVKSKSQQLRDFKQVILFNLLCPDNQSSLGLGMFSFRKCAWEWTAANSRSLICAGGARVLLSFLLGACEPGREEQPELGVEVQGPEQIGPYRLGEACRPNGR